MRTEHELFLVTRITPKSRAKVCTQWTMSLSPPPPRSLATDRSQVVSLVLFLFCYNPPTLLLPIVLVNIIVVVVYFHSRLRIRYPEFILVVKIVVS